MSDVSKKPILSNNHEEGLTGHQKRIQVGSSRSDLVH